MRPQVFHLPSVEPLSTTMISYGSSVSRPDAVEALPGKFELVKGDDHDRGHAEVRHRRPAVRGRGTDTCKTRPPRVPISPPMESRPTWTVPAHFDRVAIVARPDHRPHLIDRKARAEKELLDLAASEESQMGPIEQPGRLIGPVSLAALTAPRCDAARWGCSRRGAVGRQPVLAWRSKRSGSRRCSRISPQTIASNRPGGNGRSSVSTSPTNTWSSRVRAAAAAASFSSTPRPQRRWRALSASPSRPAPQPMSSTGARRFRNQGEHLGTRMAEVERVLAVVSVAVRVDSVHRRERHRDTRHGLFGLPQQPAPSAAVEACVSPEPQRDRPPRSALPQLLTVQVVLDLVEQDRRPRDRPPGAPSRKSSP